MDANKVDIADEVIVIRGDWAGQKGKVESKADLFPDGENPPKSLLTIRLESFQHTIQKNNLDVEKVPGG